MKFRFEEIWDDVQDAFFSVTSWYALSFVNYTHIFMHKCAASATFTRRSPLTFYFIGNKRNFLRAHHEDRATLKWRSLVRILLLHTANKSLFTNTRTYIHSQTYTMLWWFFESYIFTVDVTVVVKWSETKEKRR